MIYKPILSGNDNDPIKDPWVYKLCLFMVLIMFITGSYSRHKRNQIAVNKTIELYQHEKK